MCKVLEFSLEDKVEMDLIDSKVAMMSGVNRWGLATKVTIPRLCHPCALSHLIYGICFQGLGICQQDNWDLKKFQRWFEQEASPTIPFLSPCSIAHSKR
jgi:hypothetical protein